ncbi:serine/threonine protein kinase [Entomophthora muscae]|uniref:Serine/threonine protein kinase n=1 Tax=Entomophthora muscae TaxID=34485 RepID=A0ACC2SQ25_9FUNG|nr:serine/threonine protein kinase [Entomophthora muscae]
MASFFRRLARPFTPTKAAAEEKVHFEDSSANHTPSSDGSPTIPPIASFPEGSSAPETKSSDFSPPRNQESTIYRNRRRTKIHSRHLSLFRIVSDPPQVPCSEPEYRKLFCGGLCFPHEQNLPEPNRFEPLLSHFRIIGPILHAAPSSLVYNVVKRSTLQVNTARIFKKICSHESDIDYRRRLQNEILVATRLEHPNIMKLIDVCLHSHMHFVITEGGFYDGYGLLGTRIAKEESLSLLWDLLEGLDYLHSVGVAHLDLKLENLAIYHGGQLKICNFGKACSRESASPGFHTDQDTVYSSPELISQRQQVADLSPCDMWAAGIIGFVFATGEFPWRVATLQDPSYCWFVTSHEVRHPLPFMWSELLCKLLSPDVSSRYTSREALLRIKLLSPSSELVDIPRSSSD